MGEMYIELLVGNPENPGVHGRIILEWIRDRG
jgi:hypothetical protein